MFKVNKSRKVFVAFAAFAVTCLVFSSLIQTGTPEIVTPIQVPCTITTTGNAWSGDILFDLEINSAYNGPLANSNYYVVMNTGSNQSLAMRQYGASYGVGYNILPDLIMFQGESSIGGPESAPTFATNFWNVTSGATEAFPNVIGEHDVQYDPVNNTFLTLQDFIQTVGTNQYVVDEIVEFDAAGNVLWTWNMTAPGRVPLSIASPFNLTTPYNGSTYIDFSHCNSLDWDYNDSIIYLNSRNLNTFYKINETSGNIIWGCGEYGNFTLLGSNGQPLVSANGHKTSLWYNSHDTKQVAPDVFTMFDNDEDNETNNQDCRSSMIELTLNETSMTAYVNFRWEAPPSLFTLYAGGTILLPNGDYLGDFADASHHFPNNPYNFTDSGANFVEVNSKGQVVRTWTFPVGCYVYRVQTFSDPANPTFYSPTTTAAPSPATTPAPTASPIISSHSLISSQEFAGIAAAIVVVVIAAAAVIILRKRAKRKPG